MSVQTFRLFLSSPGDVAIERRRIAAIVSRLNGECAGRARIDTVRWETETYQAHATFQSQIPQAVACDLVLTLFKWRLGTELPPDFPERLPTGEPYPSGTAYELLTSIEQRRAGAETPDVFVWRYTGSSPRLALDDPDRDRIEHDWLRLKGFFDRHFLTPEGHFLAAFQTYASEDDLEAQVDALLRRWLETKVAAGRVLAWPEALKGSPFPGLEAYGRRHAAVFFGRDRDIARAMELWREVAARGAPFLLIVGASGAGKSSLARAGLASRVTVPGVVEAVDLWRSAAFRPGDSPDDPLAALAAALMSGARDVPASEEGRGPALPEIAGGDIQDAAGLADAFAREPEAAAAIVTLALDRIGEAVRAGERRERAVRADLALVVDQLDELFASALPASSRDGFVAAVRALVATGRVWVVATLRADLYAAMLDHPGLKALKEAGASLDLAPPGPAELAEIVRRPAEAADLAFGRDPATGEGVDERLLREAERPDMLPLVQLALARLYEGRRREGDATILPFDVYAGLGGLSGIIDEVGERALLPLDAAAIGALPGLTRGLAQLETEGAAAGTLTVTPLRLSEAAPDAPHRRLVDALVASRLLTLADAGDGSLVRLAHQRVLTDWARTRDIVAGSADFYRIRSEIERRRARWQLNRRPDLLLPRGLPLAEAENIVSRYGNEIAPETRAYVRASRARAGRAQMVTAAAAAVFAVVAVLALFQTRVAQQQTELALRNFGIARETVRTLVFNVAQGLRSVSGLQVQALKTILTTVQAASDQLLVTAPDDPDLLRSRATMFVNFAEAYLAAGDIGSARLQAREATGILRALVRQRPDDVRVERDLSVPLTLLGNLSLRAGDLADATASFGEALALARTGLSRAPADVIARQRVGAALDRLGEAHLEAGDQTKALAAYEEMLALARLSAEAAPRDADLRRELGIALSALGFLYRESGDLAAARERYEAAAAIGRAVAAEHPVDVRMQRALSVDLVDLGDLDLLEKRPADALAKFDGAVAIERELASRDPDNAERAQTLATALERRAGALEAVPDLAGALAIYDANLATFRRLTALDPANLAYQRSLGITLERIGGVRLAMADPAGAALAQDEALRLGRSVVARQPGNAEARRSLNMTLRDLAESRRAGGDIPAAVALLREAAASSRELTRIDPGRIRPYRDHVEILVPLARAEQAASRIDDALLTYDEQALVLRRVLELRRGDARYRGLLAVSLVQGGALRAVARDPAVGADLMREGVLILSDLARTEPGRFTGDYLTALGLYGQVAAYAKDMAAAREAQAEIVRIRREAAAAGGGAEARAALAAALAALAEISDEPLPLLREAAAIMDGLTEAELDAAGRQLKAAIAERLAPAR